MTHIRQIVRTIAEKHQINNKTAAAFLEHLADLAIKETKKSGVFVLPGLGRLVKANRKARTGRIHPAPEEDLGGGDICSLEEKPSTDDDKPLI